MRYRSLLLTAFVFLVVGVGSAAAQGNPFTVAYKVDIAATSGNYKPANGCATSALTQDARIWSLEISLQLQAAGLNRLPTGLYQSGGQLFYPVISTSGGTLNLSSPRRDFQGHIESHFDGSLWLSFDELTLADLGDLIDIVSKSQNKISTAFTTSKTTIQRYRVEGTVPGPAPAGAQAATELQIDQAINSALGPDLTLGQLLESLGTARLLSQGGPDPFGNPRPDVNVHAIKELPVPLGATVSAIASSVETAKNDWKTVSTSIAPALGSKEKSVFTIDEPCLQFGVAPVLNNEKLVTAVNFKGRYDFLNPTGDVYSKFRFEGDAPLGSESPTSSGSTPTPLGKLYFQRLKVTNITGVQKRKGGWIVAAGGLLSYSTTRNEESVHNDEWQAGGRLTLHAPNLTGFLPNTLPGAGTSPIIFIDFTGQKGADPADKDTHFALNGNLQFTVRANVRTSVDVLGKIGRSAADSFGTSNHFAYIQTQFRYNISKDWDFLMKYMCGRQDPDYRKFCGWQSGIAVAMGR